jgi:hypothetical protein
MSFEITDVSSLRLAIGDGWQPKYLFFWRHTAKDARVGPHVLSQWWPAAFEIDDQSYSSAEQYMMAEKPKLFADEAARQEILKSVDPKEIKALGRRIAGFDEDTWQRHRFHVVVRGNIAKFGQQEALRQYLFETGEQVIVEASPVDGIWGIGLAADDPRAQHPDQWRGLNLLGFALMAVRRSLT